MSHARTPTPTDATSPRAIAFDVTGMTCAGCAGRVEKALAATPGVRAASINLALERAEVEGDAAPEALVNAVRETGFGVREAQVDLSIAGMSCANCAGRAEKAMAALPGVLEANVNLAIDSASVRYLPAMVDAARIAQAATEAGYAAAIRDSGGPDPQEEEAKAAARRDLIDVILAMVLAAPLVAQMVSVALGLGMHLPVWAEIALATPVQFWAGRRFYRGAWHAIRARAGNMDVLVAMGSSAAYFYSLWIVAASGAAAGGQLYFEASAVIIALVLLGKLLEGRAKRSAAAALRELMALRPETARVLVAGEEIERPIAEVALGDMVVVRPGERLPVDGTIMRGETELDESLLTGESMPVHRVKGDGVTAGALNGPGLIRIRAERIGADTTLAKIGELVAHAQTGKAPVQRKVDRISAVFVPVVLVIAALTFAGWLAAGGGAEMAFRAAISVLVIACPCALGLATPVTLVAGTGAAARSGILIRDIESLERAAALDTIVFDKTGTLTRGKPELAALVCDGVDETRALTLAASAQRGSEHPLGRAMAAAAESRGLATRDPEDFRAEIGAGISAIVGGARVQVGTRDFVAGTPSATLIARAEALEREGRTVVWISIDGAVRAAAALADAPRDDAPEAIRRLNARGVRTMLLTGDNRATAARIAATVGIKDVAAEVKPDQKAEFVAGLVAEGRVVGMVGDGVNDAPALAAADVGIAMGGGADAAREAAGVTLMRSRLLLIPAALDIAGATARKIRQNLFWAFAYNVVCLPIAAAGLLNPAVAGAAMALSSVSVVANALLLKRWTPDIMRDIDAAAGDDAAPRAALSPALESKEAA